MTRNRLIAIGCLAMLAVSGPAWSETSTFKVKHQLRHPTNKGIWWLLNSGATLVLDDSAKTLVVQTKEEPLDLKADAIEKVIFEVTTHARGGGWGDLLGVAGLGPIGGSLENKTISDYWCLIEYRGASGPQLYMLEIPKDLSAAVMDKMKAVLGSKVVMPKFDEKIEVIKSESLPAFKTKNDVKADKNVHPLPEMKPDKALIVVACPMLDDPVTKGPVVRLHANDKVIAVNSWGTYAFAYLDPGEYQLAAQVKDSASSLRIKVEAGKDYYFLEDIVKDGALLTRHSKELVMHQITGARYADWK